jgi:hypothetical protein
MCISFLNDKLFPILSKTRLRWFRECPGKAAFVFLNDPAFLKCIKFVFLEARTEFVTDLRISSFKTFNVCNYYFIQRTITVTTTVTGVLLKYSELLGTKQFSCRSQNHQSIVVTVICAEMSQQN